MTKSDKPWGELCHGLRSLGYLLDSEDDSREPSDVSPKPDIVFKFLNYLTKTNNTNNAGYCYRPVLDRWGMNK